LIERIAEIDMLVMRHRQVVARNIFGDDLFLGVCVVS